VASLEKLAGVAVSVYAAEHIVARWGAHQLNLQGYSQRVDKDLVIQIDGTTTHLEEGWKEIKVGASYACDCADPQAKLRAISYIADWHSADQFRELLDKEALINRPPTSGSRGWCAFGLGNGLLALPAGCPNPGLISPCSASVDGGRRRGYIATERRDIADLKMHRTMLSIEAPMHPRRAS
jgi:hypothetical protein